MAKIWYELFERCWVTNGVLVVIILRGIRKSPVLEAAYLQNSEQMKVTFVYVCWAGISLSFDPFFKDVVVADS